MNEQALDNDEIDLFRLLNKAFLILKRQWLILLVFFTIGLIAGAYYYSKQKSTYKSTLLVETDISINEYAIIAIDGLKDAIESNNINFILNHLDLLPEDANRIINIEGKIIESKKNVSNYSTAPLKIELFTKDTTSIKAIHNAIITYIKNYPLIKNRITLQKKVLTEINSKINTEITQLDSIKALYGNRNGADNYMLNVGIMNESILNIYERKIGLENYLNTINSFDESLIFKLDTFPTNPKSTKSFFLVVLISLLIGIVLIAFIEIKNSYSQRKF